MLRVALVVPDGALVSGLEQARQGLLAANAFLQERQQTAAFDVFCIGLNPFVSLDDGRLQIRVDHTLEEAPRVDLALVPPLQHPTHHPLPSNHELNTWLRRHHHNGGLLGSLCGGALVLADTGLLDGQEAVVHWAVHTYCQQRYPAVLWRSDLIVLEQNGILTSGGATSASHLILRLIERHASREAAIWCAKIFQLDWNRQSQLPFALFEGQKGHGDTVIRRVQEHVEAHYAERITVDSLADRYALSRRSLERRFRQATGLSPLGYLQRVRVEAAKQRLESTRQPVADVMTSVGYLDDKAFREVFRRYCGMSPTAYRSRYSAS